MCGIVGATGRNELSIIKKMAKTLKHRGPDSEGYYNDNKIGLGMRRLKIIDLETGNQPMFNQDKSIVTIFNGEIYNYKELYRSLNKPYQPQTGSDSEVILPLYIEHGPTKALAKNIRGMYSFILYDRLKDLFFVCRDHIGIKPLYYYNKGDKFIFSSSINSILRHSEISFRPNDKIIRDYLLHNNTDHTNQTFFKNIMKFPKGSLSFFDIKTNTLSKYIWWKNKNSNYRKIFNFF